MKARGPILATMRGLCLAAALTGGPLRQAEAAEDFAHSLGEVVHAYSIEEKDGGVGDDSGSTILRAGHQVHVAEDASATPGLDTIGLAIEVTLGANSPATILRVDSARGDPCATPARHAWLQRFLF
jgi:hypothetical protein